MIPNNWEYYRPDTLQEAINCYQTLQKEGKKPHYFSGGTEIITLSRMYELDTEAIIDLKAIPELYTYLYTQNELVIGSALTLTTLANKPDFPLLSQTVKRIADHTNQDKITLGGNLAGTILYNEAALPFIVTQSDAIIATITGLKRIKINQLFNKGLKLNPGEFIVQLLVKIEKLHCPFVHAKRTKNEKIGYPVVSLCAIKDQDQLHIAFSGVCPFPFHSKRIDDILNQKDYAFEDQFTSLLNQLPAPMLQDIQATLPYRQFVLKNMVEEVIKCL